MNSNTQVVIGYLKEKNIHAQVLEGKEIVRAAITVDSLAINLLMDCSQRTETEMQGIKLVAQSWYTVPSDKMNEVLRCLNMFNGRFRYMSFFSRDNEVWATMIAYCRRDNLGKDLYEQLASLVRTVSITYPELMKLKN